MLRHVLGWGVGGVNVHVNLRRMHILRHVLGCGVGCVNVHVKLRHMHMLRHVLGWGVGCVNVHVNLRHMRMLRHVWVSPCWYHNCRMRADVDTDVKQEQDLVTCRRSFMLWFAFHTIRALCFIKSGIPCSLAMWSQNWCEASGCGNGVGWTPNQQQTIWTSLVALWRCAWRSEKRKISRTCFQEQISCKLQDIIKNAAQIPRDF